MSPLCKLDCFLNLNVSAAGPSLSCRIQSTTAISTGWDSCTMPLLPEGLAASIIVTTRSTVHVCRGPD